MTSIIWENAYDPATDRSPAIGRPASLPFRINGPVFLAQQWFRCKTHELDDELFVVNNP
jgi:hypothetical protein